MLKKLKSLYFFGGRFHRARSEKTHAFYLPGPSNRCFLVITGAQKPPVSKSPNSLLEGPGINTISFWGIQAPQFFKRYSQADVSLAKLISCTSMAGVGPGTLHRGAACHPLHWCEVSPKRRPKCVQVLFPKVPTKRGSPSYR